jgi:hypothetical protein
MKPPVLNLPENYYISPHSLKEADAGWEVWDKNIPNIVGNSVKFPHRPVARLCVKPPEVWYWPVHGGVGDRIQVESLDAAVKHLETMVGLGMVGHGYTKGMLDTSNT